MDAQQARETELIDIEDIIVGDRLRRVDEASVKSLAESIKSIGLLTPVTVRVVEEHVDADGQITNGALILIAGAHRLAACKSLGMEKIECFIVATSDIEARLSEIAENLHRAELSAVERAEQIDEWRRLTLEKVANNSPPLGGEQPRERGHRKTAESLGISKDTVRNAEKIANLPQETRDKAREEGWSQSKLLGEASKGKPKAPKAHKPPKVAADPLDPALAMENWLATGMTWWNKAPHEWRSEFLARIDTPVMDARFG